MSSRLSIDSDHQSTKQQPSDKIENGNGVCIKEQPDQRGDNSQRPPMGLKCTKKIRLSYININVFK